MDLPAPLAARVQPISGESLLSLVARAAHANVFPRLASLLAEAGIGGHPAFAPFTAGDQVDALAALLGVQPDEVAGRMHLAVPGAHKGVVGWSGGRMERRWIEARARRVSPASLSASAHHRLEWTHRALSFCPESFERLVDRCPSCAAPLGWTVTLGLDRCERCKASLLEADTRHVDAQLHARLRSACKLISPEAAVRQVAQSALPAEFQAWDAAELFSALVELGMAFERPDEGRASTSAEALRKGCMGLVRPQTIARGQEVLQGWPDSYGELVGRIWQARNDQGGSMALRELGLLGRWFDNRAPDCAFRSLLRNGVAAAADAGAMPLKRRAGAAQAASSTTLTLTEASQRFDVSKATLVRLVPQGACLASGKLGRGGAVRLRSGALSMAVNHYRAGCSPAASAARLGVPAYVLPAFVDAGLIQPVSDADARLLAGGSALYARQSIEELVRTIEQRRGAACDDNTPLTPFMRGKFNPKAWAGVFEALASGELRVEERDTTARGLLFGLEVEREQATTFMSGLPGGPCDSDVLLTAADAGLLLGVSDVFVPELVGAGLLPVRQQGRSWCVALNDLVTFDARYMLSTEAAAVLLQRVGPARDLWLAYDAAAQTRHLRIYLRANIDGEEEEVADIRSGASTYDSAAARAENDRQWRLVEALASTKSAPAPDRCDRLMQRFATLDFLDLAGASKRPSARQE